MSVRPNAVIISGGAESVSLAVAESLWRMRVQYAVVSIVRNSILDGLPGCASFSSIWSSGISRTDSALRLADRLADLRHRCSEDLILFPTEDDSLFLLHTCKDLIASFAAFSAAGNLSFGGLDKAELFAFLQERGFGDCIVPTVEVRSHDDARHALTTFGWDTVFKPAFKPWAASVGPSGQKVISKTDFREPTGKLLRRLEASWHLADRWIAQKRMPVSSGTECSACIVRSDRVDGCQVTEVYKYPKLGGSAVLVRSTQSRSLLPLATRVASEIDLQGMCEMTFLPDQLGYPRLLELNTRPWLQIELVEKCGYPIVGETIRALKHLPLEAKGQQSESLEWIHAERFLLGWVSGDMAPRWESLCKLFSCLVSGCIVAVYSSKLPKARWRWIAKNIKRFIFSLIHLPKSNSSR